MTEKGKLAIYWAASCGGCEISILAINERILDVAAHFDIVFCPCIADGKVEDVVRMEDGAIDLCLFNGGVRTSEQEYMAQLLRRKSKVLVAFGACAIDGGIPGLANCASRNEIFATVFDDAKSNDNPERRRPRTRTPIDGTSLHLPEFYDTVRTLGQVVQVDYSLPGCPPEAERILEVLEAVLGAKLPPVGTTIGAETTVCDECRRTRGTKRVTRFKRTWEVVPDPDTCLIEQGLVCAGIATRAGCGARCPEVNSPCIGCYGANAGVRDLGARMLSALASVVDSNDPEEIERIVETGIPDPIGTFYRFGLAGSRLGRAAPKAADLVTAHGEEEQR